MCCSHHSHSQALRRDFTLTTVHRRKPGREPGGNNAPAHCALCLSPGASAPFRSGAAQCSPVVAIHSSLLLCSRARSLKLLVVEHLRRRVRSIPFRVVSCWCSRLLPGAVQRSALEHLKALERHGARARAADSDCSLVTARSRRHCFD